jgi:serine/threonine protein kinase
MRDFEPYFCLLEECETPFEVLNSFDGLLDHLQTHLRPKFHLRYDNADSMEYLEEGFEFQGRSADEITEQELTMLKQSHQRKEAFMFTTCVFCGGYPDCLHEKHPNRDTMEAQDDLRKHIKQHMQDNALLFPPPRSDDLDVDQGLESVDITLPRSDIEELAAETGDFVDFCDREQCDCKTSASWTTDENIPHLPESIDWQHILKGSSIYNIYGDVVDEFEQRYRYVSHLGHGNSGTVEEVLDQITGRIYARKTIRLSGTTFSREAATKIFQNEVKTFLSLEQHHHIIRIHTTYATSKALCILLEPVAREGDLDEYLADYEQLMRSTNITNPRAVAITATLEKGFGCLAAGLAFMHERRIRHKDIKPRNILIHEGTLIYINFGYAFVSDGLSRSTTEGPAEYLTRRYSPPEVIENKNRNSKSDVFSLGCVFVDMFLIMNRRKRAQPKEQLWAMMDSLHAQILSTATPAKLDILPHAIIGMTALQNSSRLCSTHVAAYLLERINLRCHQCASSPIDEWKERVRGDRCPPLQMEDPKLDIHRTGIQSTLSPLNNRHIGPPRTTSTFQPNTQTRYFWDSNYNRYQIQAYNHTTRKQV